jgi:membrane associated rhomboid family serine protease
MAKQRPSQSRKRPVNILEFLLEPRAAVFLIVLHGAVFFLFRYFLSTEQQGIFLLSPQNFAAGRFWTVLTTGLIHIQPLHLVLNMVGVFVFGRVVERHLGPARTLLIYFGSLGFSLASAMGIYAFILHQDVTLVGASGAIMGLISAAVLLDPFLVTYELILPLPLMLKGWMFFYADLKGFGQGERDGVSHLAHLTGFLSIAVLVFLLSEKHRDQMRTGLLINISSFLVFLLLRRWILLI